MAFGMNRHGVIYEDDSDETRPCSLGWKHTPPIRTLEFDLGRFTDVK